jgi:hypothetical protein
MNGDSIHYSTATILARDGLHMSLMTLVAVVAPWAGETELFVITQAAQLRYFYGKDPTLFYSVPRDAVLDPAVCPAGLTPQSWQ